MHNLPSAAIPFLSVPNPFYNSEMGTLSEVSTIMVPQYHEMMNPLLEALRQLGGSGTVEETEAKTAQIMQLSDEQLEVLHDPEKGGQTQFGYRLAWARTYLKKFGLLENSARAVWALTAAGREIKNVDSKAVVKFVRTQLLLARNEENDEEDSEDHEPISWQQEVLETIQAMEASAFERLTQRLLRESGFTQVEVTGQSGDGGIDGKGILRLGGLLSFHVYFQCKKYKGSVGSGHVRDFRGAMAGRADKGLIITTGSFSKDAMAEATRDGAPPIDLVDGDHLVDLLKNLSLGIKTRLVSEEEVEIDKKWFEGI